MNCNIIHVEFKITFGILRVFMEQCRKKKGKYFDLFAFKDCVCERSNLIYLP